MKLEQPPRRKKSIKTTTVKTTTVKATTVKATTAKSLFPKTKTIGRWIYVYDDEGNVIREIVRPFGKTSVPLAQIRKAVRKVIAERLQREADEDK